MKRFIPLTVIALFFSITVFAQADEDWVTKKYKIDDFSENISVIDVVKTISTAFIK